MLFGQQAHQKILDFLGMEKQNQPSRKKRKSKSKVEGSGAKLLKLNSDPNITESESTTVIKISSDPDLTKHINEKYPVLLNTELIQQFLKVTMTNNQKGRIRTLLRDSLKSAAGVLEPDIINNKLQGILNSSDPLTDTDLRKIRILFNMLKTAALSSKDMIKKVPTTPREPKVCVPTVTANNEKVSSEVASLATTEKVPSEVASLATTETSVLEPIDENTAPPEKLVIENDPELLGKKLPQKANVKKPRGPKRFVVFIGNLPADVNKEKIMQHFSDIGDNIKDVRIPEPMEGKLSRIAFLEVSGAQTYEVALSKHHSMLENKRINVLYTTQDKGSVSKAEAKGKTAKLVAMQKAGQLIGSVPLNKKRSQRRAKRKAALAKEEAEREAQ